MHILIVYETIEGQTGKIAGHVADRLKAAGHKVTRADTADPLSDIGLDGVDKVILAAPVHERRHPKGFEVFVTASRADLDAMDTLMISVSLKAAFADGLEEARDFLTEFEMRTGFSPKNEALVAGAVRSGSYDYFAAQVLQYVVLSGQDKTLADGDHEFTDWDALDKAVDAFVAG